MPSRNDHTTSAETLQAADPSTDEWTSEGVSRLPSNVQQQARVLGAGRTQPPDSLDQRAVTGTAGVCLHGAFLPTLEHLECGGGRGRRVGQRLAQTLATRQRLAQYASSSAPASRPWQGLGGGTLARMAAMLRQAGSSVDRSGSATKVSSSRCAVSGCA
jgi:hypothetical protein